MLSDVIAAFIFQKKTDDPVTVSNRSNCRDMLLRLKCHFVRGRKFIEFQQANIFKYKMDCTSIECMTQVLVVPSAWKNSGGLVRNSCKGCKLFKFITFQRSQSNCQLRFLDIERAGCSGFTGCERGRRGPCSAWAGWEEQAGRHNLALQKPTGWRPVASMSRR